MPRDAAPHVTELRGAAAVERAADEWRDLLVRIGEVSPFLTPEWAQCCIDGFGETKDVRILLAHRQGQLVGVAPLWRDTFHPRGIRVRRLGFIESPDSVHIDFVLDPRYRARTLASFVDHLEGSRDACWDMVDLERSPAASPNLRLFQEAWVDRGGKAQQRLSSRLPVISLQRGWQDYLASRSQKYRKTNRNIVNRMARLGEVTVELHTRDTDRTVLAEAIDLSARSWKQGRGVAIASREDFRRFFESLTSVATARGWLQLWLVRVDGRPVAMEYDLAAGGRVYALRSDFDEEFREQSPGAFLQFKILEHLFRGSYVEYNTGPGVNPYKLHMADASLENRALRLFQRNLTGTCLWALEAAMLPWARGVRAAVGKSAE